MATTTTNLGLTKPAGTDEVDIAVINANMDKIDSESMKMRNVMAYTENLDTLYTPGKYRFSPSAPGLPNGTNGYGIVEVMIRGGDIHNDSNTVLFQRISDSNNATFTRIKNGNVWSNWQRISYCYDFGNLSAANINELSAALIARFNTCANGAHPYVAVWAGQFYIGGTIHKIGTDIGVMTFFPSVSNATQASMKIYNAGGGWNSTSI